VNVPRPYGYLADVAGREAFLMERLEGEAVGRRLVQRPEFAAAREALPEQMAVELARIHALDPESLDFLPHLRAASPLSRSLDALLAQLDGLVEPHPAIELALLQLRQRRPVDVPRVVCHGDFRVGNFMVNERGLVGVLDWEFAHVGDPREDLAWPLVRAWRFGMDRLRLGGIGQPEAFFKRYAELTGRTFAADEVLYFELLGNVRWAIGALSQARRHLSGEEHSVELAVLGRLASEVEHEILTLLDTGRP
jgi:aminoglycoside phosphotransferase (APT) family kinase protein